MFLLFKVPGTAVAKARPRVTAHGCYTPRSTREYEAKIRAAYLSACAGDRFAQGTPVALKVLVVKAPPQSATKKRRAAMLASEILPTMRPDWDNYGKIVSDALNGVAWEDDSQVVNAQVFKCYGETDALYVMLADAELFAHELTGTRAMFAAVRDGE